MGHTKLPLFPPLCKPPLPLYTANMAKRSGYDDDGGGGRERETPEQDPSRLGKGPRIRCPKCGWVPGRDARWMCSCLHVWNTFDTRGTCPACHEKWHDTQCLRCHAWSKHEAWYFEDDPERGV
jgi:hypothetical protein